MLRTCPHQVLANVKENQLNMNLSPEVELLFQITKHFIHESIESSNDAALEVFDLFVASISNTKCDDKFLVYLC